MAPEDLRVKGVQGGEDYDCVITKIERSSGTDFITCVIQISRDAEITAVTYHRVSWQKIVKGAKLGTHVKVDVDHIDFDVM